MVDIVCRRSSTTKSVGDQIGFFRTAIHEQHVYDEAMERAANLYKKRRLEDFHLPSNT
jgi:hypothetical protein